MSNQILVQRTISYRLINYKLQTQYRKITIFCLVILFAFTLLLPALVFATIDATDPTTSIVTDSETEESTPSEGINTGVGIPTGIDEDGNIVTKTNYESFMDYMASLFSFALKLGAALTALMIIYAGYKYLTSQGNTSATGEAKEIIIGSLSGFAMLLLIYLLLNVLGFETQV